MDNLKHLISAYFYELWNEHEYSTWEAAVDDYIRRSPDKADATPSEIDTFLSESASDKVVSERLDQWGFDYSPTEGDRQWLSAVRDRIRQSIETSS